MLRSALAVAECSYGPNRARVATGVLFAAARRVSAPVRVVGQRLTLPPSVARASIRRSFTTSTGKGKEREREAEGGERDPIINLMSSRMRKRDYLVSRACANDHAQAKEIGELDELYELWKEWQDMNKSVGHLLQMTSAEAEPDEDMRQLALEEAQTTLESLEGLRSRIKTVLLPQDAADEQNAIMELRPGVGGLESASFVAEVTRMYSKYCESVRDPDTGLPTFEVEELSVTKAETSSEMEAFKEVILSINGKGAYGLLRFEAGVHRVQRVPATQNTGRLQSSTIAVVVLPGGMQGESDEGKKDDVVDPKDVKTEVMRSRGAGGQHVNKTESAIRLTHEPTGITVSMQDSRSQHQNRTKAWAILRARLQDLQMKDEELQNRDVRRLQVAGMERSDRIRTYNFRQDRVTDHRLSISSSGIDSILNGEEEGGLGYIMNALRQHQDHLVLHQLQKQTDDEIVELAKAAS